MSVLLPMLLAVPIVLLVVFELELPKKLWKLVQPLMQPLVQMRDDRNVPHVGLALQRLEGMVVASPSDDWHERSRAQRQAVLACAKAAKAQAAGATTETKEVAATAVRPQVQVEVESSMVERQESVADAASGATKVQAGLQEARALQEALAQATLEALAAVLVADSDERMNRFCAAYMRAAAQRKNGVAGSSADSFTAAVAGPAVCSPPHALNRMSTAGTLIMADDDFAELTASLRAPTGRASQYRPTSELSVPEVTAESSVAEAAVEMLQSAEPSVAERSSPGRC